MMHLTKKALNIQVKSMFGMKRLDIGDVAAHTLTLTPKESYEVAKRRTSQPQIIIKTV